MNFNNISHDLRARWPVVFLCLPMLATAATVDEANFNNFSADTTAMSSEMNENFRAIKQVINTNALEIDKQRKTLGLPPLSTGVEPVSTVIEQTKNALDGKLDKQDLTCGNGQFLSGITTSLGVAQAECGDDMFTTLITDISAGVNSGLQVNAGATTSNIILSTDTTKLQAKVTDCPPAQVLASVAQDGSPVCIPSSGVGEAAMQFVSNSAYVPSYYDQQKAYEWFQQVVAITVTLDQAGSVLVSYNGQYRLRHTQSSTNTLRVAITQGVYCDAVNGTTSGFSPFNTSFRIFYKQAAMPTADYYGSVTTEYLFTSLAAGTHTFCLVADSTESVNAGAGNNAIGYSNISAVLYPSLL